MFASMHYSDNRQQYIIHHNQYTPFSVYNTKVQVCWKFVLTAHSGKMFRLSLRYLVSFAVSI